MRVEQSKKQEAKAQLMAEKQIQKSERAVSGSASVLPNPQAVGEKNNGRLVVREIGTQTHRSHDEDSDSSGKHYSRGRGRHSERQSHHHHRRSPRHKEKEEEVSHTWGAKEPQPPNQGATQKQSDPPPDPVPGLQSMIENHAKTVKESKEESKKKCGIMVGKSVSQHFHLYMANVFFRLASEATFGILQLWLFGYKVSEMFKCEGFPCPHVVDCFISRPAEKTIFLNFMLGFTIFCVILNLMEFKYLCYLFFKARVKLTSSARPPPMLPKPLAYPSGPCPAYEPLGFDIPEPRNLSPKRERVSYPNLPPPPPPTLSNSQNGAQPNFPANGAFDVDMVSAQFGHVSAPNGAVYQTEHENRKKWMLPKKK